jgi:hypothetical protein
MPKNYFKSPRPCITFRVLLTVRSRQLPIQPQPGGSSLSGSPRLLTQYIPNFPPPRGRPLQPQIEKAPRRRGLKITLTELKSIMILVAGKIGKYLLLFSPETAMDANIFQNTESQN